jgi:lipopolysaccharide biosynthesis protein
MRVSVMSLTKMAKRLFVKTLEVTLGTAFLLPLSQRVWSKNLGPSPSTPQSKAIAIVAHVFYPELLDKILLHRDILSDAVGTTVELHLTAPPHLQVAIQQRLPLIDRTHIHVMPNRGRDIAPFLILLNSGTLDHYDAVLKLHTKRSPHLWTGNLRRRLLYTLLAGNVRQVQRILLLFDNPETGVVGWQQSFRNTPSWWMANQPRVADLTTRTVPPLKAVVGFFEGSMFWVRPKALEPLKTLALVHGDFETEEGQVDGALHHAVERMFTLSAWGAGFSVLSIRGRVLHPYSGC